MPAKPFSSGKQKRAKERARGERAAPDRVDARELDREEDAGHFVDVPAARPGRELAPLVALAAVDGEAGFEERARALARDRGALGDDGREVLAVEGVEAHEEGLHLAGPEGRERRVKVLEVPEHLVARADVEGLGVPVVARAEPRLAHRGADRRLPKRPFPVAVVRRAHELVELDLRSGGSALRRTPWTRGERAAVIIADPWRCVSALGAQWKSTRLRLCSRCSRDRFSRTWRSYLVSSIAQRVAAMARTSGSSVTVETFRSVA